MVSKDLVNDVKFALSLNDNQIDSNTLQTNVNSIEEYLDIQKANSEFALLDKEAGDNNPVIIIPTILAIQSYLNAPDKDEEVKSGMTGSENILLAFAAGKVMEGGQYLGKQLLNKELKASTMAGVEAAAIETSMQSGQEIIRLMNEQNTYNPLNLDYSGMNLNYTNIIGVGLAGRYLAPSIIDTEKGSLIYSYKARNNLKSQKTVAQSQTKIDKLDDRIKGHNVNMKNNLYFQGGIQLMDIPLTTTFSDKDNE